MDWVTPQQLAALRVPGVPGTDRGVRMWAKKNLVVSRTKVRGKGYEIAIASLPQAVRERVVAHWVLHRGPAAADSWAFSGAAGRRAESKHEHGRHRGGGVRGAVGERVSPDGGAALPPTGGNGGVIRGRRDRQAKSDTSVAAVHGGDATCGPARAGDRGSGVAGAIDHDRNPSDEPTPAPVRGADASRAEVPVPDSISPALERPIARGVRAALEGVPAARGSGAAVPADPRVTTASAAVNAARDDLWNWLASRPESIQAEARHRAAICLQVRQLLDAGVGLMRATEEVAQAAAMPVATLRRWWYGDARLPGVALAHPADYAPLLAPRYAGREVRAEMSEGAWQWIKADYLRPEQPALAACYRRLMQCAPSHGWVVPSLKTVERRLDALPWQVLTLAREGRDALLRKLPHVTRTKAHLAPLEAVNADGHVFDLRVRLPSGKEGRPVLVAWQDIYSGKVLAYRVGETLNQHLVRLAFGEVVERYGVPGNAYLDNGREFANKWLTGGSNFRYRFTIREDDPIGLFGLLGVVVHWTTPYHGQSKPVERCFRDLCEGIARHPSAAGAYTGNSPVTKPDNYGERALTWDEFRALVDAGIAEHNARVGRRTETARGRSFDATFSEAFARAVVRRPTAEQRRLWLLAAEGVTVRQDGGVHIGGNRYWTEALPAYIGQRVVVRFDPERLDLPVAVYTPTGELIGEAERLTARFDDAETAKRHARANRRRLRAASDLLAAEREMTAAEAAAQLPALGDAPEPPNPAAVRLMPAPRRVNEAQELRATGTDNYVSTVDAVVRDWMRQRPRMVQADE